MKYAKNGDKKPLLFTCLRLCAVINYVGRIYGDLIRKKQQGSMKIKMAIMNAMMTTNAFKKIFGINDAFTST
jgi:hypothetical protein